MKKLKLFSLVMVLGGIALTATSAQKPICQKNADCPSDMLCVQLEAGADKVCVAVEMSGSGIKCYSSIHYAPDHAVVECSSCSLMIDWTDNFFNLAGRCSAH